jgi:hypothetical protein
MTADDEVTGRRVPRWLAPAGVALLAALAAVVALPAFLAAPPETALVQGVTDAKAVEGALKKLSATELAALVEREHQRLIADPLNRSALQNLAILAGLEGKKDLQEKLALVLARYARRSVTAQIVAVEILFSKGDYATALEQIDGVLRSGSPNSKVRTVIFDGLRKLIVERKPRAAIAAKLAENPPWRATLLKHIFSGDTDGRLGYELISDLRSAKSPLNADELRDYMTNVFDKKLYDLAYFVWLDSLEAPELSRSGLIFDGKFDLIPKNLNFGWNFVRAPNIRPSVEQAYGKKKDTALSVNFFESRDNIYHVYQYVVLQAGSYTLKANYVSDNFRSEGGLKWRFRCWNEAQTILAESEAFREPSLERAWTLSFTVPPSDCQLQFLRLESATRATADQRHRGRVFFDNFEIVQLPN